eukprot:CAMPEP_0194375888 /NCGR_PEP_ID=MMETSP0174-20130528/24438_1 /TAXON_ID=216777 /ORGANISM="Proboscia alata, Strain PI-D3" /LENGTH=125 /DNA_ID=CAMNT_0039156367 /DNA_START=169 /DNA_END=547 /DNA_ORIENTATION=+
MNSVVLVSSTSAKEIPSSLKSLETLTALHLETREELVEAHARHTGGIAFIGGFCVAVSTGGVAGLRVGGTLGNRGLDNVTETLGVEGVEGIEGFDRLEGGEEFCHRPTALGISRGVRGCGGALGA